MTTNQDQPPALAGLTREAGDCSTRTKVTETAGGAHLLAGTPGPAGIHPRKVVVNEPRLGAAAQIAAATASISQSATRLDDAVTALGAIAEEMEARNAVAWKAQRAAQVTYAVARTTSDLAEWVVLASGGAVGMFEYLKWTDLSRTPPWPPTGLLVALGASFVVMTLAALLAAPVANVAYRWTLRRRSAS